MSTRRGDRKQLFAAIDELSRHERALGLLVMAERTVKNLMDATAGQYDCQVAFYHSALHRELCNKITAAEKAVKTLRDEKGF